MARKRLELVPHSSLGLLLGGPAPRLRVEKRQPGQHEAAAGKASVHPRAGPLAPELEFWTALLASFQTGSTALFSRTLVLHPVVKAQRSGISLLGVGIWLNGRET